MKRLRGLFAAFAMYSIVPVPLVDWDEDSLRHVLGFFPLVGLLVGGALWLWGRVAAALTLGPVLFAAVAAALPVLLSGGIHLDGFCDTVDALSSHRSRERQLEILKDPHVGAFAVMGCLLYFMVTFALWSEGGVALAAGPLVGCFVLSRALSAVGAVCLPQAKKDGTLSAFAALSDPAGVTLWALILALLAALLMLALDWQTALACLAAALVVFFCYRRMALKKFGGVTGDLAGFFLCCCELATLAAALAIALARRGGWL